MSTPTVDRDADMPRMSHWLLAAALCGTVAAMLLMAAGYAEGMFRSVLLVVASGLMSTTGVVVVCRLVVRGVARDRSQQAGTVQDLAERVDALEQRVDGVEATVDQAATAEAVMTRVLGGRVVPMRRPPDAG